MEPRDPSERGGEGPPRRALLAAALVVIVLTGLGLLVARSLVSLSKLQDCAATGRRDC